MKKNKWRLVFKSYDSKLLDHTVKKVTSAAKSALLEASVVALPTRTSLFNVLKSPFIYKKSRDQFIIKKMRRIIDFSFKPGQSTEIFREILVPSSIEVFIVNRKKSQVEKSIDNQTDEKNH